MSYQSPIDVIIGQMSMSYENEILKATQNVGINVDKNELLKALQYDRGQYQKGYTDRDLEIVRCKDCKYWDKGYAEDCHNPDSVCFSNGVCSPDWFCPCGEGKVNFND